MEKLNDWAEPVEEMDELENELEDSDKDIEDIVKLQIASNALSGDPFGWFPN